MDSFSYAMQTMSLNTKKHSRKLYKKSVFSITDSQTANKTVTCDGIFYIHIPSKKLSTIFNFSPASKDNLKCMLSYKAMCVQVSVMLTTDRGQLNRYIRYQTSED